MHGDVEAVEVLGEVLDHVVALGLAVDEDVEAELFLQLHDRGLISSFMSCS